MHRYLITSANTIDIYFYGKHQNELLRLVATSEKRQAKTRSVAIFFMANSLMCCHLHGEFAQVLLVQIDIC